MPHAQSMKSYSNPHRGRGCGARCRPDRRSLLVSLCVSMVIVFFINDGHAEIILINLNAKLISL
jgi:hypothetical protein